MLTREITSVFARLAHQVGTVKARAKAKKQQQKKNKFNPKRKQIKMLPIRMSNSTVTRAITR